MPLTAFKYLVTNNAVHNLTSRKLTFIEKRSIGLGLKFIPTPKPSPTKIYTDSLLQFRHRTRLAWHFKGNTDTTYSRTRLRLPSSWKPPNAHPALERTIRLATSTTLSEAFKNQTKNYKNNISKESRIALKRILDDKEIVVTPADKNLGPVISTRNQYIKACYSWLHSTGFTKLNKKQLQKRVTCYQRHLIALTKDIYRHVNANKESLFLSYTRNDQRLSPFYIIWKIHKATTPTPSRPICPAKDTLTYNASIWIDEKLRPVVNSLPTHCPSSIKLIRDIETNKARVHNSSWLASFDIQNLYPSIPIKEGCSRVAEVIKDFPDIVQPKLIKPITNLLMLVLSNNIVIFKEEYFLQLKGTAMGTPAAVIFAVIFIFSIEWPIIKNALEKGWLSYYTRYIDDTFLIATNKYYADRTFNALNKAHKDIIWTKEDQGTSVNFLDLTLFKGNRIKHNKLDYRLYQKHLNRFLYLPFSSFHAVKNKRNFILNEFHRYAVNNSLAGNYHADKQLFALRLRQRGYPGSLVGSCFKSSNWKDRFKTIFKSSTRRSHNSLTLTLPMDPFTLHAPRLLQKWPNTPGIPRPRVTFKSAPSLFRIFRRLQVQRFSSPSNSPEGRGVFGNNPKSLKTLITSFKPRDQEDSEMFENIREHSKNIQEFSRKFWNNKGSI